MPYHELLTGRSARLGLAEGNLSWDKTLLRVIDVGLAGCIFVVPYFLGGRMALGQLVLVVLAITVATAWALRQALHDRGTWRRSGAEWLWIAGALLLALQITPMPTSLLAWLSPHTVEILPLWNDAGAPSVGLGPWTRISLTPAVTQTGLVLLLAYGLLFFVTVQRIRNLEDVEQLLRHFAIAAAVMAAFGIVQLVASNGKFLWFIEHPHSDTRTAAKGAFVCPNHFAQYLALGTGPLLWWILQTHGRRRKRPAADFASFASDLSASDLGAGLRLVALGVVVFAVMLSFSRGGAVATLLAIMITVTVCWRASALRGRFVAGLGAVALLIGASLAIYGHQRVAGRLDDLTTTSLDVLDRAEGRRTIWKATIEAIPNFPILGAGGGSLRYVYPMHLPWQESHRYYSHAENGPLQIALETGMVGFGLTLVGIGLCASWCLRGLRSAKSSRTLICLGAVSAGLAGNVVHSLVDFSWYMPGCMLMVAILAACACRLWQIAAEESGRPQRRSALPRFAAMAGAALVLLLGVWMLNGRLGPVRAEPHWFRYLAMQGTTLDAAPFDLEEAAVRTAEEDSASSLAMVQKAVDELEQVTRWDPGRAEAHMKLAAAYMMLFDRLQATSSVNPMPLGQVADAAIQSRFASREALSAWLTKAVGEHARCLDLALWHTRRGLALCPLQGDGYAFLGELCFLEGAPPSLRSAYLAQARKVRPYDGIVLFYAGQSEVLAGNLPKAIEFWQQAFQSGRPLQETLIESLTGRVPVDYVDQEIQFFVETFQPDLYAFRMLYRRYKTLAPIEKLGALQRAYARAAEAEAARLEQEGEPSKASGLWMGAMRLYAEAGELPRQTECARHALRGDPNNYAAHYSLACCLAAQQQYAEAEQHFRWCAHRKPNDTRLEQKRRQAMESSMQVAPTAALEAPQNFR